MAATAPKTIKLTIFIDLEQGPAGDIKLGLGAGTQEDGQGNLVKTVAPDSAAQRGGLQPGDEVSTWDGVALTSKFSLAQALAACQATKRVTLEVMRQINKPKEMEETSKEAESKLFTFRLTLKEGQKSGLKLQGQKVIDVVAGSLADKAGLRVGDFLHAWDGVPLGSQFTPQQALQFRPDGFPKEWTAVLLIRREAGEEYDDSVSDTGSGLSGLSMSSSNWPSNLVKIQLKVPENKKLGLRVQGNTVLDVFPGSPADVAGLRYGDVVQTWDETPLSNSFTLRDAMETAKTGPHDPVLLVKRPHM
eukprot:CAMPEP_0183330760 /NCGR_PEP_ID=MMETSP0164_2-20130417/163_1 /TAXON_ID=221442 /ORGANISM="Coccolithus pelagicus ssp braarudi, Strain PLY182g" /LENGTH=303 /DNA_ID=CAMNT_0025499023 /DNA_START=120 /DNA_END=1031 /DNA_ORIENTATION=+